MIKENELEKSQMRLLKARESTLVRYKQIIQGYNKVIMETPDKYRKGMSQQQWIELTFVEIGKSASVSLIGYVVANRDLIERLHKERVGDDY